MKYHKYADLFPLMNDGQLEDLAVDIKEHGQLEDIWTYKGEILDGRNRFLACQRVGVKPRFKAYEGDDVLSFVVSINIMRRHLNSGQRAILGVKLLSLFEGREGRPEKGGKFPGVSGDSRDLAGKTVGVDGRYIDRAEQILKDAPDLEDEVVRGELPIVQAYAIATGLKTESQRDRAAREVIQNKANISQTKQIISRIGGHKTPVPKEGKKEDTAALLIEEALSTLLKNLEKITSKELLRKWKKWLLQALENIDKKLKEE